MSSRSSQGSEALTSALSEPDTGSSPNANPTKRPEQSSGDTGPTSRSTKTSADSTLNGADDTVYFRGDGQIRTEATVGTLTQQAGNETSAMTPLLISSAEASPARTSQSPENEQVSQANAQDSSLRQPESLTLFSETEDGFSLRMFPDSFPQTADEISPSYLRRWPTSGFTTSPGECWTVDSSECHSDGGAFSSLPDVLVADVPPRFYLSPKAAAGIIRRAEKRGRELPEHLAEALRMLSTDGKAEQTATSARTSSVRRLTPTECERLQGFPDGWTIP